MDLRYISGRNRRVHEMLQKKGYDLESLFSASAELIKLIEVLQLPRQDSLGFVERLKDAYDESQGKEVEAEVSKKKCRDRISVQSKATNRIYFFRATENPNQFECENCEESVKLSDRDLISHIKSKHNAGEE
ncbi:unnamed protein product [Blepharisma stoltei]|uniref:C2H2-type domain-containing protein n=1 Tax=Blepharisma stoltei TaxID=1481888 RepID=A0AAU9IZA9_9CILI|nr:unnamed protein product [Blepharisma stoltei]